MYKTSIFFQVSAAHLFDSRIDKFCGKVVGFGRSPKAARKQAFDALYHAHPYYVIYDLWVARTRDMSGRLVHEEADCSSMSTWYLERYKLLPGIQDEMKALGV